MDKTNSDTTPSQLELHVRVVRALSKSVPASAWVMTYLVHVC